MANVFYHASDNKPNLLVLVYVMGLVVLNYDERFANDWDQRHNIRSVSDRASLRFTYRP